ncbi:MAG: aspartate carbamoyltransferase [Sulfolobales archaeon]|nr:aspartate carbamoyltransferase [Sulfolobales archaeon]MCX8199345.1 aspartate carbamoyltransferase [Sulfolobales archaeon]MDW8170341.1 aspartate carbamoyltransferase [Desulfurococcaceae archaeon]
MGRDVISILDFKREELEELFELSDRARKLVDRKLRLLEGKVVSLAFFEPSTRTRMSFEVAARKLGADVIGFSSEESISIAKGENLADTVRMLDSYSDLIVIRHKLEGAAKFASEIALNPVINGGDGKQHHPTQAMIDLYTVRELFSEIDGLTYAIVGDLRYGRAAASFIYALTLFKPLKVYLVSPPILSARPEVTSLLKSRGIVFEELSKLDEVIEEVDVMYVTRVQRERFPDPTEYEKAKGTYKITLKLLEKAKHSLKILHPLPKVDEIELSVDNSKHAAYFLQASLGVPVRMALLTMVLGGEL